MKLFTLRSLAMVALCLSASLLVAGKKEDGRKVIEVTSTKDAGKGSLRCALEKANRLNCENGAHIVFKLEKKDCNYNCETGTWVICPKTELPEVTAPNVWVDFTSQCGYEPNTNSFCKPSNAKLVIELDGSCATESEAKVRAKVNPSAAAILPVSALRFRDGAFGARVSALNAYNWEVGIHNFAANHTTDASVLSTNPTNTTPKPNLVDILHEPTAFNAVVGGTARSARTSLAAGRFIPAASAAVIDDSASLIGRSTGLTARRLTINIDRTGTLQVNPNALKGIIINRQILDNAAAAVTPGVTFDFDKLASAGHSVAEITVVNHDEIIGNNYSLGTTLNRRAAIRPRTATATTNAAVFVPGHGFLLDDELPTGRGSFTRLTNGHLGGLNTGILAGTKSHPAAVVNLDVTAHQIGTAAANVNGIDHALQGDALLQTSRITKSIGFGARFRDILDGKTATNSKAALIGAIRFLRNNIDDNTDTGVIVTTTRPASSNLNTITGTAQTTGVAVGRAATYVSELEDRVINNRAFNYTFGRLS